MTIKKIPEWKPISKRAKCMQANAQGQIPNDCINFNHYGRHTCVRLLAESTEVSEALFEESDCIVLKGGYCEKFK